MRRDSEAAWKWAMKALGVQMIPACRPQAQGRSEQRFGTWQGRLPQELRLAGIRRMEEANRFLRERYIPEMNRKFRVAAEQPDHAFSRKQKPKTNRSCATKTGHLHMPRADFGKHQSSFEMPPCAH